MTPNDLKAVMDDRANSLRFKVYAAFDGPHGKGNAGAASDAAAAKDNASSAAAHSLSRGGVSSVFLIEINNA